jgi:hypothetical protein
MRWIQMHWVLSYVQYAPSPAPACKTILCERQQRYMMGHCEFHQKSAFFIFT